MKMARMMLKKLSESPKNSKGCPRAAFASI
jgi:hypothetical protein